MMSHSAGVDGAMRARNHRHVVVVLWEADQAVYEVCHDQGRVGRRIRHSHQM